MIAIIPTYCNPVDLSVLLVQLQQQTTQPRAIFLADNSEGSYGLDLVKRYQWAVPIYVHPKAGTIYDSWNVGIKFAGGDDVVILNDDILIPQDFLYRITRGFSDGHKCLCPTSPGFPPVSRVREGYAWRAAKSLRKSQSYVQQTKAVHTNLPLLTGWCFALHHELIEKVGLFDTTYQIWYGDTDYSKRITDSGYTHTFINELFVQHYGTSSYSKIDVAIFNSSNYLDQIKYEKRHKLPHVDLGWDKYA